MRRVAVLASMAAVVVVGVSGCRVVKHDVQFSLSGEGGAVEAAEYATPDQKGLEKPASLPWSKSTSMDFGDLRVAAKVTKGTVGCVITVEGKQVASQQAEAGSTVECTYTVPK
ncbi:hypothetical protein F0L68_19495 [Solihabitans fulvus]|uniref:MmpS family membrane protein n=1 Tax=Solihabitans fulvus TaxID=1892852 RepID=A0A5B2XDE2_9PSEU|nr:hypothetical protein [Solihabitans fulvus]KAA2260981.1 hypothetical protein F0L68_19495 [Solihabitans fulvus]